MKILLTITYDGTNYFGWQRQKNVITVQQIVEEKLSWLLKKNIKITGASRTDSKVHALDQKAVFNIDFCPIPINKFPLAINNLLPNDIVISGAEEKPDNFQVRYDVKNKTYRYKILNSEFPIPIYNNYVWHIKNKLNKKIILEALPYFIGTKDFKSFCSSNSSSKTTIRTIYDFNANFYHDFIIFEITGNGFLYNMIRIIISTIIELAKNKIKLNELNQIFARKKRVPEVKTAPPQGLTLIKINYK